MKRLLRQQRSYQADQVAKRLEKGWQTDVGEGGDSMSTGEKQLISFARAVLADPAILFWMKQPLLLIQRQSS